MRSSVIIPSRNRARSLKQLLESLEALECPDGVEVEILVADNGSTDDTEQMLREEQIKARRYTLKVLREERRGKASALNSALRVTSGDYIVVLDDDIVVDAQLLRKHLDAYAKTTFDAVQGRVLPGLDEQGRGVNTNKIREYNIPVIDYGKELREIRGLTGTNMSFKKEVFEKVGFFDTRLGPGASGFSEDTEYSVRIRKAGFKIGYTPHAIAYHELNPARYGRVYNRLTQYRKGLSRSMYRNDSIMFNVIPNLFANCLRFGFYTLLGKRQKAYKTEGRIMKCWGYLAGKMRIVNPSNASKGK